SPQDLQPGGMPLSRPRAIMPIVSPAAPASGPQLPVAAANGRTADEHATHTGPMTVIDRSPARDVEPNLAAPRRWTIAARSAVVASYALLGTVFGLTHLLGLSRSFWHDEIYTVANVIRPGPDRIFAGPELNHQAFSILAWANQYVLGHSEFA